MITLNDLRQRKLEAKKFSCLTCYDASMAEAMQIAAIDTILIGDSLGMVIQGKESTLGVSVDDIAYHTAAVCSKNSHALIIADLPFMQYSTVPDAIAASRQVMQAGAHMVKIEGGAWLAETVRILTQSGVPACVHLGLTPQSVHVFGGYKLQAKTADAAQKLLDDCQAVVEAGAAMLLLECVPSKLAKKVQQQFAVPVIGIGAGADCDGQVLVVQDMLGLNFGKTARFVRNFMADQQGEHAIVDAFKQFHQAVLNVEYPAPEHGFQNDIN